MAPRERCMPHGNLVCTTILNVSSWYYQPRNEQHMAGLVAVLH